MISRALFTGLILAGGLGRRMQFEADDDSGPLEKGLALLHGEPLVAHACRALSPQVAALRISANRQAARYAHHAPVIADDPALGSDLGPLAGVERGLATMDTPWLAVLPVDVLGVPADMVERLAKGAKRAGAAAAYATTRAGGDETRAHPLCMVARADLLDDLRRYLKQGDRKVFLWMQRIGAASVLFDDEQAFDNINTCADLARAGGGRT